MGLSLLRGADCHCGDALCDEEGGLSVEEAARKRDEVRLDRIVHLRRAVRMVADGGRSSLKKQAAHGDGVLRALLHFEPPSHAIRVADTGRHQRTAAAVAVGVLA